MKNYTYSFMFWWFVIFFTTRNSFFLKNLHQNHWNLKLKKIRVWLSKIYVQNGIRWKFLSYIFCLFHVICQLFSYVILFAVSGIFVNNSTEAKYHFCHFVVPQCKAFSFWLLINQFNVWRPYHCVGLCQGPFAKDHNSAWVLYCFHGIVYYDTQLQMKLCFVYFFLYMINWLVWT